MNQDVVILIPTSSDEKSALRLGYTLTSLAMQDCAPLQIVVRDEGQEGIFSDRNIRLLWDHLVQKDLCSNIGGRTQDAVSGSRGVN